MATKDETDIREDDVRAEHLQAVHVGGHWAYLLSVIVGAFLLMLGLIALLGAMGG
jgi:hypothetical protein